MDGIMSLPGAQSCPRRAVCRGSRGPYELALQPRVQRALPGSASDLPAAVGFASCSHCQKRSLLTEQPRGSQWIRFPPRPIWFCPFEVPCPGLALTGLSVSLSPWSQNRNH